MWKKALVEIMESLVNSRKFKSTHKGLKRSCNGRITGVEYYIYSRKISADEHKAFMLDRKGLLKSEQPVTREAETTSRGPGTDGGKKCSLNETADSPSCPVEEPGEPASGANRVGIIHTRANASIINKEDNKQYTGKRTTTTPRPEEKKKPSSPLSYPAGKDKNSLDAILPLIPERHRNPMVLDLIGNALESHPEQYIRDAVAYASDQVKGGWIQYRKYLDGAIQGRWAAGYLEVRDQAPSVYADTLLPSAGFSPGGFGARGRYPNGTITGSRRTDGNCQAAVEFLNRRAMARGEVTA